MVVACCESKSSSINKCERALRKVCGGCLEVMTEMAWQHFRLKATKHVEHLTRLRDGLTDATEIVKESLQLGAVISDRHITLVEVAKFSLIEDDPLELVVMVEVGDHRLESKRVCLTPLMDNAHNLWRTG
jgi:hypothetical protein